MTPAWPRYLLFADVAESPSGDAGWRFVLSAIDSPHTISAEHFEPGEDRRERLELMAALRGLEALDQPSLVTLVCPSKYVRHGFGRGLKQWREGGWKWECFGRRVMVRDHDLWRRVDRTLKFHRVDCRSWRFETADDAHPATAGRVEASQAPFDWPGNRMHNDPALLVVSPPRRVRRGVIRFDTDGAATTRSVPGRRQAMAAAS